MFAFIKKKFREIGSVQCNYQVLNWTALNKPIACAYQINMALRFLCNATFPFFLSSLQGYKKKGEFIASQGICMSVVVM